LRALLTAWIGYGVKQVRVANPTLTALRYRHHAANHSEDDITTRLNHPASRGLLTVVRSGGFDRGVFTHNFILTEWL
jgi:hypothetical protein